MHRFRIAAALLAGLTLGALLASAHASARPPTGGPPTLRPLFTADAATPPLVAACDQSAATVPLVRYPDPGDTAYIAQGVVTGPGWLTLVAGPRSAQTRTPCNPCTLRVPAPGWSPLAFQVSLTLAADDCPAPGAVLTSVNLKVGGP